MLDDISVLFYPERMHKSGPNGDKNQVQPANPGSSGKWCVIC